MTLSLPPPTQELTFLGQDQRQRISEPWYRYFTQATARINDGTRTKLTTDATYNIATTGNDDTGIGTLTNPFATVFGALAYVAVNIDMAGQNITLQVADGTYDGQIFLAGGLVGQTSAGSVILSGGPGAILTSDTFATLNVLHAGSRMRVQGGITIQNTGSGSCIRVADLAYCELGAITWGTCGLSQIEVAMGAAVYVFENFNIAGNAGQHIRVQGNGVLEMYDLAHTANGTFSNAFAVAGDGGIVQTAGVTYTGTVTGKRFDTYANGGIQTFVDNLNYFPGTIAGTVSPGGFYG